MPEFLSPKQVAEITTLSRSTIWRLTRSGEFPQPISISRGRKAYHKRDIEAWIEASCRRVPSPSASNQGGE